ncbi:MAG: CHAD domain-containing protein [Deltaproteobacteria bacterium]|nr:CHAD domain-containing protein [Deltaproteobacteria bacterium]
MGDHPKVPRAAQTIRARAAEVIEKQRDKMRKTLGSAIEGRDPEGVHDMRVASRRLRAALAVFEPWLEGDRVRESRRALRTVTRALGSVRELDVMRIRLAKLGERASPERRIALEVVDSRVAKQRLRARARMMRKFASVDLDHLDTRLCALTGSTPDWAPSDGNGDVPEPRADAAYDEPIVNLLHALAPGVVEAARQITESPLPDELGTAESATALHEVRIRAKKLRYQLEIVAPHLRRRGAQLVDTLKDLQDRLGDYHDDSVLEAALQESVERQTARRRPLLVHELRRLRNSRRAALRRDERACRAALDTLRVEGYADAIADALIHIGALTPSGPPGTPGTQPAEETTVTSPLAEETTVTSPLAAVIESTPSSDPGYASIAPPPVQIADPIVPPPVQIADPTAPPPVQIADPIAPPPVQIADPTAPPPVQIAHPIAPPPVQIADPIAPPPVQIADPIAPPPVQIADPIAPLPVQIAHPTAPPPVQIADPTAPPPVQIAHPIAPPPVQIADPIAPPPAATLPDLELEPAPDLSFTAAVAGSRASGSGSQD